MEEGLLSSVAHLHGVGVLQEAGAESLAGYLGTAHRLQALIEPAVKGQSHKIKTCRKGTVSQDQNLR